MSHIFWTIVSGRKQVAHALMRGKKTEMEGKGIEATHEKEKGGKAMRNGEESFIYRDH